MPKIPREAIQSDSRTLYLGIDPGSANGGIALIAPSSNTVLVWSMPTLTEQDLWRTIRGCTGQSDVVNAVIEWVHPAIQGIGKSAQSKLYGNYMACRMAMTAADIPFEDRMAAKWQAALGIQKRAKSETDTKWKDRLRGVAQRLYPNLPVWDSTLKIQREVCDALLIATYSLRKHTGTLG